MNKIIKLSFRTPNGKTSPVDHFDANQLGYYMGLSVYVLENPNIMNQGAPRGIYGWGGLQYTEFWIDPKNSMFVVFMTRSQSYKGILEDLIRAVYKVVN